ncbi:MAG: hypothetical protein JO336_04725 [Acidobacteriia bacterium]|nr:hypothetical protein [Terriglobia bacterium]
MATSRQVEANRQNALKSTGPKTPEGKAAVSSNSIRHGLRARRVILKGENADDFEQLAGELEAEWQPNSPTERYYVQQMAIAQWKLVRVEVAEANLYDEPQSAREQVLLLDRVWQAQQRFERSFSRAQRELERLQHARSQIESPTATPEMAADPADSQFPTSSPRMELPGHSPSPKPPSVARALNTPQAPTTADTQLAAVPLDTDGSRSVKILAF